MAEITKDLGIATAYGYALSKGYTGTEEEFAQLLKDVADGAGNVEAWADGTINGEPVPEDAPQYHNNSKYYSEQSDASAQESSGYANDASGYANDASGYANEASGHANTASGYADNASDSADAAALSASHAAAAASAAVGSPLVASTVADMTDTTKIYVYVGSEAGYTAGDWYYWDGAAWTDGGIYNSAAVQTDTTLSVAGMAADAKAAGDAIGANSSDITDLKSAFTNGRTLALNERLLSAGTTVHDSGYYTTDYLPFGGGGFVWYPGATDTSMYCVAYDSELNRVDAWNASTNRVERSDLANTYAYIRVTYKYNEQGFIDFNGVNAWDNRKPIIDSPANGPETVEKFREVDSALSAKVDDSDLFGTEKNLLKGSVLTEGHYKNGSTVSANADYAYFTLQLPAGSYTIGPNSRFIVANNTNISSTEAKGYYTFTLDSTKTVDITVFTRDIEVSKLFVSTVFAYNVDPYGETFFRTDINPKSNILTGKKIIFCGDSFTEYTAAKGGSSAHTSANYDDDLGVYKTYPYWLYKRNNFAFKNEAISGSTMTYTGNREDAFSKTRYKNLGLNLDYIILKFGINDNNEHATIGTIDDATNATFYGAWNVVLGYLRQNYPLAKIGIIISNGISDTGYVDATIAVAKKWGCGFLNEATDSNIPVFYRTSRTDVDADYKQALLEEFAINYPSDTHPDVRWHEYESTIVENWMRSL